MCPTVNGWQGVLYKQGLTASSVKKPVWNPGRIVRETEKIIKNFKKILDISTVVVYINNINIIFGKLSERMGRKTIGTKR